MTLSLAIVIALLCIFQNLSSVMAQYDAEPEQQQQPQQPQIIFKPLFNDYGKVKQLEQYSASNDQYAKTPDFKTTDYAKMEDYDKDGSKYDEKNYAHQPYGFGYNIEDGYGNKQWRHEKSSSPHQVIGSYGFKDKNGILREVEYIADKYGFRAVIKTTEPGTASSDPAYVKMNSNPVQVDYYPSGVTESYPEVAAAAAVKAKDTYHEQPAVGYKQPPNLYQHQPGVGLQAQEPNFIPTYAGGKGVSLSLAPYETNEYMVNPESNHIIQTKEH